MDKFESLYTVILPKNQVIFTQMIKQFFRQYWVLFLFIALKLIIQLHVVHPVYELHRDEYLHLGQADHLAFGFISVPPMTALFSKLIFFLGGSLFWIRCIPALFGVFTLVFAWLIAEQMNGSLFTKIVLMSALTFSVLMRLNILFQPNSFEILAWTMMFYFLISFIRTEKTKWLYFWAMAVVLGFYNKYTLIFPLTGLLIAILFFPQRKLFFTVRGMIVLLFIAILLLPNIFWQISHHFPVIHHMSRLKESQLDNNSALGFLRSQVLFFFGSLPLIVAALIGFVRFKTFIPYRFIGLGFLITLGLFAMTHAKDYYACGLYPMVLVFGGIYLEKIVDRKWQWPLNLTLVSFNLFVFLGIARCLLPVYEPADIVHHKKDFEKFGMLRWEDGKNHELPQDFSDMLGWKEMAQKTLLAYQSLPKNELSQTIVFCDNYGQTGAINYYNRHKMPEAYAFNTDYIFWIPHFSKIKNVLFVGEKPGEDVLKLFQECRYVGEVTNKYAREKGTPIYLLLNANDKFTAIFYGMADRKKQTFDFF